MAEQTPETTPTTADLAPAPVDRTTLAIAIATGTVAPSGSESGTSIMAAHKDLNSKGKGACWYRMVWRDGQWQYFAVERLPSGSFLARDRRATVHGDVFTGELVCQHDKGGPVDRMWLVILPDAEGKVLAPCDYRATRDGRLCVTLPDGQELTLPNPRR